jgi:hypothetical protein
MLAGPDIVLQIITIFLIPLAPRNIMFATHERETACILIS